MVHLHNSITRPHERMRSSIGEWATIIQKHGQVIKTMNKEDRNNCVIPLPAWVARFCPHIFFTPQHILTKPGKSDHQTLDASQQFTPTSVPVNMMTSTNELTQMGKELQCLFGVSFKFFLTQIWNFCISYPNSDIILHASDVKSCFAN